MSTERRGLPGSHSDDARLREEAWNLVASRYQEFWVGRLRPFRQKALAVFHPVPPGPFAVPGCGPGAEVLDLAADWPERSIVATDTAERMVGLLLNDLRQRQPGGVIATVGAAESLSAYVRQAAGILSCFTLDVLANPLAALADWSRCLRPGGSIVVVFWTRSRPGSAAAQLYSILQARVGHGRLLWEARAAETLSRLGLRMVRDERIQFEVPYSSPDEYFDGMVGCGPLRFLERKFGTETIEACRKSWLVNHGLRRKGAAWVDLPEARLWALEQTGGDAH